jgi:hypothetical protein
MLWRKIEAAGVAVLAGLLFLATLVVGFMMFVDGTIWNPPVVYDTLILPTDKTEYQPGSIVSVFLDVSKNRNIGGNVTWSLVNGRVFPYSRRSLHSPMGAYEKWYTLINERLPTDNLGLPGSVYHFEALVEYQVNPLRVVTYKLRTTPFTISQPTGDTK